MNSKEFLSAREMVNEIVYDLSNDYIREVMQDLLGIENTKGTQQAWELLKGLFPDEDETRKEAWEELKQEAKQLANERLIKVMKKHDLD